MHNKTIAGIYGILVVALSLSYVGSTADVWRHWKKDYLPQLRRGQHHNTALQAAFNEYGESSVALTLLEEVQDTSLLPERERFWLAQMKREGLLLPQRMCGTPGRRGQPHTDESRKKMSDVKMSGKARWAFISPDGEVHKPELLNEFCRARGLASGAMSRVASGKQSHHQGWRRHVGA